MRFGDAFLRVFNPMARLLGVLWIIGGIFFLVCAFILLENGVINTVVGVLVIAIGVAFLLAKRVTHDYLDSIQGNRK
ncbi:MAG: hypothetical protein QOK23_2399 [Gammaproteobacteria bacterium]|nr:hypothetical protein [Gammaproteobacteria bacterium]